MSEFQAREIWPSGTTVDRKYVVQSTLGRGGFGTVYLAKHRVLGHDYVIKRLHSQFAEDPEFINKFVKEAQAIARLKGCPQIVEVFDMTQTEDHQLILVMEYMSGGDLGDLIKRQGRLSIEDALWYALQTAEALKAAHALGFVHRDVKPQNVLLGADPKQAKLTDFGIIAEGDRGQATSVMRGGSAGFAPLEQWQLAGKQLDGRTDLYALGATLYLMLTGRMPYGNLDLGAWTAAVQAGPPPGVRGVRPEVREDLDGLVSALLERSRERRPRDVAAVIEQLKVCAAPLPPPPPSPVYPPTVVEPPPPRSKPQPPPEAPPRREALAAAPPPSPLPVAWKMWLAVPVLAALGGGGWWAMSNSVKTPDPSPPVIIKPPVAVPQPGQTDQNPTDKLTYVWIPPGTFDMGCSDGDKECYDDEKPVRKDVVIPQGFWMGETEVTQAAYKRVMGKNPSSFKGDNLPVESVSWDEADGYCRQIGGKLPTEEQWEYAARAGSRKARYGPLERVAWYDGNSKATTNPVRQKEPNKFGLYDMLGNVWEWVDSWYDSGKKTRVLRGGSWISVPRGARASYRSVNRPDARFLYIGFRCSGEKLVP